MNERAIGQRSLVYQSLGFPNERHLGEQGANTRSLITNGLTDQKPPIQHHSRNAAGNAMLSNESQGLPGTSNSTGANKMRKS